MATFTKRKAGWQAKIRRKGYPAQSASFKTKTDAEKWARDIESTMDKGRFVDRREAESTTLLEALERYEREITPRKKGAKQEINRISLWKRDKLSQRILSSIRGADIAEWRDAKLSTGASSTTVRNDLALISHLFTVAEREWGMESLTNPVRKVKVPSPARARDRRLAPGEEETLLEACANATCTWLSPIVILALETGMRQGELLSLKWNNVNTKQRVASLIDTKNGEAREVPLSNRAISTLKEMPQDISGRVFPITQDSLEYHFRKMLGTIDIENLRFHDLRHEATSRFFEKGLNPMEAAAITGHKTLQMLKRYTHLRAEDLAKKLQ